MKQSIIKSSTTGAKKRIKDVTFDHDGAHLALCSKEQGAANNQENAIILKSKTYSKELIEKAQRVQVTLSLPDFLVKFFDLWYDDAEVLARMMGYVPEETELADTYEDWIQERVDSFVLMKSIHEADNKATAFAALTEAEYSTLLDDQEKIMKSMKEFESKKGVDNSTPTQVEKVEPVGSNKVKKEKKLSNQVETVEKSKFDAVEQALAAQKQELEKAREELKELQKAKAEALVKARTDALSAVLGAPEVESIMKSIGAVDAEAFDAVVAVFKSQKELIEKSGLFKEHGVTVEVEDKPAADSSTILQDLIKNKYAKK